MKKTLLIAAYIAFFWAALPFGLFYSASVLDGSPFQMMLPPTPHRIVGICIAAVSAFLLALSIVQFTRFSRKLPISADPPEIILQNGLFAVWRHPIYLFYTLLFIGIASIIDSRSLLYIVTPVFVMIVGVYIAIEERILTKRFGLKYTGYRKRSSLVLPKLTFIARYPFVFLFKILFVDIGLSVRKTSLKTHSYLSSRLTGTTSIRFSFRSRSRFRFDSLRHPRCFGKDCRLGCLKNSFVFPNGGICPTFSR